MTIIGTLKRETTGFAGTIRTLTFTAYVTIEPVTSKRGDKSPDFRVYCQSSGPGEIGAAWTRSSDGQEYLSVRLDDPTFAAPLNCRLVKSAIEEGYYSLVWERDRKRS